MLKMEHFHQITDSRHVARHVGIISICHRVREIVPAADRQRLKAPVALDELQDRDVVVIGVHHPSTTRMRRNRQERHPRAVAEESERLDEAGVVEAARLIKSDEDSRSGKELRFRLEPIDDVLQESLEQIDL